MAKLDQKGALVALASAAVVGFAWAYDALRRDRAQRQMHRTLVDLLLNALTADDPVTARHSRRVADLSYALAESCGMTDRELSTLRVGALLHDMGKIDDRFFFIMHSRKPLSAKQRDEIKTHPHTSAHILEPLEPLHPGIQCIVSSHHECWDGSGYPRGLDHEGIPLAARIIAVADAFDAMTQPRSYKEPLSIEEALDNLGEGSGKQFDPALVRQVETPEVLTQWIDIARRGLEDERYHLAHPSPTEAAMQEVGAGS
jgi:putative nucleotidyltransferase with HDIG domain